MARTQKLAGLVVGDKITIVHDRNTADGRIEVRTIRTTTPTQVRDHTGETWMRSTGFRFARGRFESMHARKVQKGDEAASAILLARREADRAMLNLREDEIKAWTNDEAAAVLAAIKAARAGVIARLQAGDVRA